MAPEILLALLSLYELTRRHMDTDVALTRSLPRISNPRNDKRNQTQNYSTEPTRGEEVRG
jgi:hypothetical protein